MFFLEVTRFFSNFPMSCVKKMENPCPSGKRITPLSCVLKNIAKLIHKSNVICKKTRLNRPPSPVFSFIFWWQVYDIVWECGVCRGVHLGDPKQLHRSYIIGGVLCHVIFFPGTLQMTHALFNSLTMQMTWAFALFGYVRLLPRHLQVLYLCIYNISVSIWLSLSLSLYACMHGCMDGWMDVCR